MGQGKGGGGDGPSDSPLTYNTDLQQQYQQQKYTQEAMQMYMNMMASIISQIPQAPAATATPQVYRAPEVDFTERQEQIAQKVRADYNADLARRRAIVGEPRTSPLLDEEEANTTSPLASGKSQS